MGHHMSEAIAAAGESWRGVIASAFARATMCDLNPFRVAADDIDAAAWRAWDGDVSHDKPWAYEDRESAMDAAARVRALADRR